MGMKDDVKQLLTEIGYVEDVNNIWEIPPGLGKRFKLSDPIHSVQVHVGHVIEITEIRYLEVE